MSLLLLCAGVFVAPAAGQDFRGAITGRITDGTGAAVPGVTVTATNTATLVPTAVVSNETGNYSILFLTPGRYHLTAELGGFKTISREGIEVRIGDRLGLDLVMEVGDLEETISVTAATPLLNTTGGSLGQVIDERRISMLPLSDGNPFVLSRLVPGVAYTGDLKFSRPFDNAGSSAITTDGASGGNEWTLDGSPNHAHGRRVAFVPPSDAVQEFKVETATFDAQQGHTAGATVNVTLKSGTNNLHGTSYYFVRDERLSATDFFVNRAGAQKPELSYNRFGGSLGGPIVLPKLYGGRNRSFFFGAIEWLYDEFPEPGQFTVPTEKQRNGDFSDLLSQGILIYDPATAFVNAQGRVQRLPFPGNIIPPDRISPIARQYLNFYPLPNQPGDAQGRNNFFSVNPRTDDFYSINTRMDHQLTDQHKFFVRYARNNRVEARGNWSGVVNGIRPTGNFLHRINDSLTYDHVYTAASNLLLNLRGGWSRFQEPSVRQHQGAFSPAELGFASQTAQFFGDRRYLPRFELSNFSNLGDTFAGGNTTNIYSLQPTWTYLRGRHTWRAGYDFRIYREDGSPSTHAAGRYDFGAGGVLTRQIDNSPAAPIGQELAALVLGLPSGGFIDRSVPWNNQSIYHGVFIQNDWKVSEKLTLNLGLRYEYEGATTERDNRNVRGFDPQAELAISAAAQAAYAASPIPEVPASQFQVRGGLQFADSGNRGFWNADRNNIQPRLGFAYAVNDRTVVRGGWAIYTVPFIIEGRNQPGFSQATQIVPTTDNGLTIRANLANPFPEGVLDPPGATLGPNTFLGRNVGTLGLDRRNDQHMRYALLVQRELPRQWVVEAGYVGNRGYDLGVPVDLNPIPRQYLSTSDVRDPAVINFLTTNVTNPFRGLVPGVALNNPTVQRQQLLRPFPQFAGSGNCQPTFSGGAPNLASSVCSQAFNGSSRYDSAQFRVEKRFTEGYTLLVSYTISKFTEKVRPLNPTDTELAEWYSSADIPHRLVTSGIWELPFGHDRRWGAGWSRGVHMLAGGWSIQAIWNLQSGRPLYLGNVYFNGDPRQLRTNYSGDTRLPVFDTSGFYFSDGPVQTNGVPNPARQRADTRIQLDQNIRTLGFTFPDFRTPPLNLWDISIIKRVPMNDRVRLQLHVEFLNAFNKAIYNNPNLDPRNSNFGLVTSQNNLPRDIQLAAKIVF